MSARTTADEAETPEAPCLGCGRETNCIHNYSGPTFVFLLVWAAWATNRVEGCRSCCRSFILRCLLLNLVTANVLFPITTLWWFILYLHNEFAKSPQLPAHYLADLEAHRERTQLVAEARAERASKASLMRALVVLVLVVAVMLVALILLTGP